MSALNYNNKEIEHRVKQYLAMALSLIALLGILSELIGIKFNLNLEVPIIISWTFNLTTALAFIMVWKKVASNSVKNLPLLFLSTSGIRILLAAMTILVYCFAFRGDFMSIKVFAVVFMSFYMVMLVFDTWFFIRTEKTK